jgi:hypothetical protein
MGLYPVIRQNGLPMSSLTNLLGWAKENAMRRPSIERYLMMQALQVRYLRPALDSDLSASGIGSTSILDGVIYGSYDKNPTGTYFQGIKQVCIGNMNTDSHRKSTGIRHEVRGWE